ncbi:MAG: ComEA family DNA-binding protein [Planctomycetota bacterium]
MGLLACFVGAAGLFEAAAPLDPPESLELFRPDINRDPGARLRLLPGIGPGRAAAIIEDRARNGPFASVEDLARVSGIGPATVAGLKGRATAGPPSGPACPPASTERPRPDPRPGRAGGD